MASFNDPKLSNHIADDVPAIRQLLRSVAAFDPATGNTDIPNGAKRLVETAQGYEFQSYNGTAWVTLEKWNLDVQKVDGYSASTGTTANTIPVRDATGKLPGDISGNAATASKAAALSATNPVGMGGTGGTTAQEARKNLGTPPTDHASSGTDYGTGNASEYGHNKLSDATNSTLGAAGGTAATPLAVKTAKEEAITAAGEALENFSGAQSTRDAAQDEAISAAQSSADAAQSSADAAQSSADALATSKAGINAENFTAEGKALLAGLGMPSAHIVELTLGASGTKYTAPANGWFFLDKKSTQGGQYVAVYASHIAYQTVTHGANSCMMSIPVRKGVPCTINYTAAGSVIEFKFVYAEGAEG